MANSNMEIEEVRQLYLQALSKVEELQTIGVKYRICRPQNLSELRSEIDKLQTSLDLSEFEANGHFEKLSELLRSCGAVCCKKIMKPGSFEMIFKCAECPIFKFEEAFLIPIGGDEKNVGQTR